MPSDNTSFGISLMLGRKRWYSASPKGTRVFKPSLPPPRKIVTRFPAPVVPPGTGGRDVVGPTAPIARRNGPNCDATNSPAPIAAASATKPRRLSVPSAACWTMPRSWCSVWGSGDFSELLNFIERSPVGGSGEPCFSGHGHQTGQGSTLCPSVLRTQCDQPRFKCLACVGRQGEPEQIRYGSDGR